MPLCLALYTLVKAELNDFCWMKKLFSDFSVMKSSASSGVLGVVKESGLIPGRDVEQVLVHSKCTVDTSCGGVDAILFNLLAVFRALSYSFLETDLLLSSVMIQSP